MFQLTKRTEYGLIALVHLVDRPGVFVSAREIGDAYQVPRRLLAEVLKALSKSGLLLSHRGANGGYELARDPRDISAADIIDALEGPVSIPECSAIASQCEHEGVCSVGGAWQRVNVAIRGALEDVSLSDLLLTNSPTPRFRFAGLPITVESKTK